MDWGSIHPDRVLNGVDEQGRRLVLQFAADFEKKFGYPLDISCVKCYRNEYEKYLKTTIMAENTKSPWKLKPMYEGISLGFGSKQVLSSANLTDALAEKFAKEHPKGLGLFDIYPADFGKEEVKTSKKKTKKGGN